MMVMLFGVATIAGLKDTFLGVDINMSESHEPMFKLLLKTLANESAETKAMFFTDSEEDCLKAYQEGQEARKKKLPLSANPYPLTKAEDVKYTKNLCWGEGFLNVFVSE